MPKAGGKWNTFEITAQGPRIIVVMNGVKTGEADKAHAFRGNIGLRWVQGVVKFRKVEIKATLACRPRGETGGNP